MPPKPNKPCNYPGCPELTISSYCPEHEGVVKKQYEQRRETAQKRGYTSRWQRARASFLKRHPLCFSCLEGGVTTPATVVDHVVPHRGDMVLFWEKLNWQSLCKQHHDKKTAKEVGFGCGTQDVSA